MLGHDPFGATLDTAIAGITIDGKRAVARRVERPQDAANCRIVFVSASEDHQLAQILDVLEKTRALTVSDMPDFTRRGGMIQFVDDANRVRFDVNLDSAVTAGLEFSSELLKVAVGVRRSRRSGT